MKKNSMNAITVHQCYFKASENDYFAVAQFQKMPKHKRQCSLNNYFLHFHIIIITFLQELKLHFVRHLNTDFLYSYTNQIENTEEFMHFANTYRITSSTLTWLPR